MGLGHRFPRPRGVQVAGRLRHGGQHHRRAPHVEGAADRRQARALSLDAGRVGRAPGRVVDDGGQRGDDRAQGPPRHEVPERPTHHRAGLQVLVRPRPALAGLHEAHLPDADPGERPRAVRGARRLHVRHRHEGAESDGPRHGGAVEQRHPRPRGGQGARDRRGSVGHRVAEAQPGVGRALPARQERAGRRDRAGGHARLLAPEALLRARGVEAGAQRATRSPSRPSCPTCCSATAPR